MNALISADELHDILGRANVKIFDATYPRQMAEPIRIPGAQIFDIDDIADMSAAFKHTIPSPEVFQDKMQELGLNKNDTVIVYDQKGIFMAASRAWWMLRLFGHDNVRVLDGGLPQWLAHGYTIEPRVETHPPKGDFTAGFNAQLFKSKNDLLNNLEQPEFEVVDARTRERFDHDGHIPGSNSMFFGEFIDPNTGMMISPSEIENLVKTAQFKKDKLAASCGSGVTACVNALALFQIGLTDVAVYDGSWTEWSSAADTPKAYHD